MEKKISLWDVLAIVSILAFSSYILMGKIKFDTDIMWHFKNGEYILKNGIPAGDIYSWQPGLNTMYHEWLYDLGLYTILDTFGQLTLKFLPMVLAVILFITSYIYNRNRIQYTFLFLIYVFTCYWYSRGSLVGRPGEVSILLFLFALIIIKDYASRKWSLPAIFLITVLSVNLHGGSIAQIALIQIIYIVADFIRCLFEKSWKEYLPDLKKNIGFLLAIVIGTIINPYGLKIWKYFASSLISNDTSQYINEWKPTEIQLVAAVIIIGTAICVGYNEKFKAYDKTTWRDAVLISAFLCEGMIVTRMSFSSMVVMILLGYPYVENLLKDLFHFHIKFIETDLWKSIGKRLIVLVAICLCFGISLVQYSWIKNYSGDYIESYREFDSDICEITDYIKDNNLNGARIYNSYNDGGKLILGDVKPFVDPRCDPYMDFFTSGNTSLSDYMNMYKDNTKSITDAWLELNDKYKFEYGIFQKNITYDVQQAKDLKEMGAEVLLENGTYWLFDLNAIENIA